MNPNDGPIIERSPQNFYSETITTTSPKMEERALWVNIHNGMSELNGKLRGGWRVKQITPLNVAAVGIPDAAKAPEGEALEEGETSVGEVEGKPKPTPVIFYQSDCLVIVEREKRAKAEGEEEKE